MKTIQIFIFLSFIVVSCYTSNVNYKMKAKGIVTIEGVAKNAKLGAVIHTKRDKVYYIENLDDWDEKYLNKTIIVQGKLVKYKFQKQSSDQEHDSDLRYQNKIENPNLLIIKK